MELQIKISETMDKESEWNEYYEHRIIRIPEVARHKYDFRINDFLYLRDKWGQLITLQIAEAFKEDLVRSPLCGYVTKSNFDRLFLKNQESGEVSPVTGITLGCDPEAFLVDRITGHVVAAHRFMRKYGEVGHDGMLLEFRPQPSTSEDIVTANIASLIQRARMMLNQKQEGNRINMIGASSAMGLTAGFHLHYGLPRGLLGKRAGLPVVAALMTKAFDYYIGVPSIIPEGNEDHSRRTMAFVEYGKPGGYRLDNRTFEYRLPGGINLRHPCLTRGLMALGAVVVEDLVSRIQTSTDFFSNLKEVATDEDLKALYPRLPAMETLYAIICNPSIDPAKTHFQGIKNDVRQMIGYSQRASAVESYFACLDQGIQYDTNLETNWGGFSNEEQQKQMVFL